MADLQEQRICYKFCFNLKKIASETYRMLIEAFYYDTVSWVQMLNVFMFHVTILQLGVQVLRHEVRQVKMWKICVKSVMSIAYV